MKKNIRRNIFLIPSLVIGSLIGCQPDEFDGDNGIISPNLDASFTMSPVPVQGKMNTYQFQLNNTDNVLGVFWDLGEGTLANGMEQTDVIFFPDADTYTIKTRVLGIGGKSFEAEEPLVIASSDPNYGNLLKGGKFNAGDEQFWAVKQYSGGVSPQFTAGKVLFDYGNWAQSGIYQSFQATAGQKYRIDMTVSGNGATDTWFEVYIGQSNPATFAGDYNEGGIRLALNTWAGCGKSKFGDKLTNISCDGTSSGDNDGVFTAPGAGTHYIVIRTGGANLGSGGISVDNVEIRPYLD